MSGDLASSSVIVPRVLMSAFGKSWTRYPPANWRLPSASQTVPTELTECTCSELAR